MTALRCMDKFIPLVHFLGSCGRPQKQALRLWPSAKLFPDLPFMTLRNLTWKMAQNLNFRKILVKKWKECAYPRFLYCHCLQISPRISPVELYRKTISRVSPPGYRGRMKNFWLLLGKLTTAAAWGWSSTTPASPRSYGSGLPPASLHLRKRMIFLPPGSLSTLPARTATEPSPPLRSISRPRSRAFQAMARRLCLFPLPSPRSTPAPGWCARWPGLLRTTPCSPRSAQWLIVFQIPAPPIPISRGFSGFWQYRDACG